MSTLYIFDRIINIIIIIIIIVLVTIKIELLIILPCNYRRCIDTNTKQFSVSLNDSSQHEMFFVILPIKLRNSEQLVKKTNYK